MSPGDRDDAVRIESQRRPRSRGLEQRGIGMIPDESVGHGSREPVRGTAWWDPEALATGTSAVLNGRPASWVNDLDHVTGTNRSRSPGLNRAGGSAAGSKSRRSVRPYRTGTSTTDPVGPDASSRPSNVRISPARLSRSMTAGS